MEARDKLRITFEQNPTLAQLCQGNACKAGDKVEWDLRGTIANVDAEGVDVVIDAVIPEGYELAENAEPGETARPGAGALGSEAIISPLAMIVKKKAS